MLATAVTLPIRTCIQVFLQCGFTLFLVNVARGRRAEIGDIFAGGRFFLRMLGSYILFLLGLYIGLALCIVPGIIFALMFWPYAYLIVDQDLGAMESLRRAKEITDGSWGAVFLIGLLAFLITLAGLAACGIGLLFAIPLTSMMMAVAYCRLAGLRTAAD